MKSVNGGEAKKPAKMSYWSKTKCHCPICRMDFEKEEMLSGSGRTNAGDLTDELHRLYIPTAKYGEVYPLIYAVGACPKCHLALFWQDFETIKDDKRSITALRSDEFLRKEKVENIFPHYNLRRERTLLDGAAMYYLAILCYEKIDLAFSPTIKRAILSVRLAWICNHINEKVPSYNYDFVAKNFYKKALFFYEQTLANESSGVETIGGLNSFGPDTDYNYGYNGIIYMNGILEYKYGQREDMALRFKKFGSCKRAIARIFGIGKKSKEKPGPLLNVARELYERLNKELKDANSIEAEIEDEDEDEES